jgi:acetyltransferase-like isoleucine patch superfamily enzyme
MPSVFDVRRFLGKGYAWRELAFAFVRLRVIGSLSHVRHPLRRRGPQVVVDPSAELVGARFIEIGAGSFLQRDVWLTVPLLEMQAEDRAYLRLGERVQLGRGTFIGATNDVTLADDVLTGPRVVIVDHAHRFDDATVPIKDQGVTTNGFVHVGRGAWLGAGAVLVGTHGLTVGENAVVGANAVVTKDVPARAVIAGNPARIVRRFD